MQGSSLTLCLVVLLGASGCTLTTFGEDECTSSEQCRAAFGFGFACNPDGFCAAAAPNPRCTETEPIDLFDRPATYADAIVIGSLLDSADGSDLASENASRLAITQVNDLGGVDGRTFAMVFCDLRVDLMLDTLDGDASAASGARYLARDLGIPVIIGPGTSSQTEAAFAEAAPAGTLLISHSATSPRLTSLDEVGLLWRTAPPDSVQGAAIADDLETRTVDNVAVIHEAGPYGEGLATVFQQEFAQAGRTVGIQQFAAGSDTERNGLADTVGMDAMVDEVLFISSTIGDVTGFVNYAAAQAGYADKEIFLTDTAASAQFITDSATTGSSLFDQIRGTRPALPSGPDYERFDGAYRAAFMGEPDVSAFPYAAFSYDATWLAFYGAAWGQLVESGISGATIAEGLRHVSEGAVLELTMVAASWSGALMAFEMGMSVNLVGASGSLDFDTVTEETSTPIEVWRIMGTGPTATIVLDHLFTP